MARVAREKSNSGIYHIMLRGINRQDLFHDAEDNRRFMETLNNYKNTCGYKIYGFCLMSNHIHLLIKEGEETISQAIKRIGVSYAYRYNVKYERCGHLFQGRFKSEKVDDDDYLLTVLRYIHQNPVKAGMVGQAAQYNWSSYSEYVNQKSILTDIDFVLRILNPNPIKAVKIFKEFMTAENEDKCLDVQDTIKKRLSDEDAINLIKELSNTNNVLVLQQMDKNERDGIIRKLKKTGFSIRQLVRITGLGRRIIEKA
ncbi:MAG: transposase [Heliobacteriaceae bacterium]|nr:transposase [Heliobacteriaceae bacterium]